MSRAGSVGVAVALALLTSSCSNFKTESGTNLTACAIAGASTGALIIGGTTAGVVFATDCGPGCVENKIRAGEKIHESVQHHVNRRDDALLYGVLPSALFGAVVGGALGIYLCRDKPSTRWVKADESPEHVALLGIDSPDRR
jgi:hypothetical protein